MKKVKSLSQGIKQVANPYESYKPLKKSPNHRTHRSKKGQQHVQSYDRMKDFKRKKLEMKERDADNQIENYKNLASRKKWYGV